MDAILAPYTVPFAQADQPPQTGTPGWPTNGNPAANVPSTQFPAYHYAGMMQELIAVIQAANLALDRNVLTQLRDAILFLIASTPRLSRLGEYAQSAVLTVPEGCYLVRVRLVGGGAGGGSGQVGLGGAGGGAGGTAEAIIPVAPGQQIPILVGAGGPGGIYGGSYAGGGGTTSFGTFLSATGGAPGESAATFAAGGAGGSGIGDGVHSVFTGQGGFGSDGNGGSGGGTMTTMFPGNGGASAFGGGGRAANAYNPAVQNGQAAGSGGGGCYGADQNGGAGAPGIVLVEY